MKSEHVVYILLVSAFAILATSVIRWAFLFPEWGVAEALRNDVEEYVLFLGLVMTAYIVGSRKGPR